MKKSVHNNEKYVSFRLFFLFYIHLSFVDGLHWSWRSDCDFWWCTRSHCASH